jgi:very-short-patch-repair endonuclease
MSTPLSPSRERRRKISHDVAPPLVGGVGEGKHNMTSDEATLAKNLRKRSTDAERSLWKHLRSKQIEGLKFRRQEPIGRYIVDFVCYEKAVIVEADGGQHTEAVDLERDAWLRSQGFSVLRFWNHEVITNIEGVLEMILRKCTQKSPSPTLNNSPHPNPSPPVGEGIREGGLYHRGAAV